MNKLRHNNKINNNIKFFPLGFDLNYETASEEIQWAERTWNHLLYDTIERHSFYSRNLPNNKYIISVYSDDEYTYLIQCIRTKWNTDATTVYMQPKTDDNINDFKAIAKFIHLNNNTLTKNYKELLLDAKKSQIAVSSKNVQA